MRRRKLMQAVIGRADFASNPSMSCNRFEVAKDPVNKDANRLSDWTNKQRRQDATGTFGTEARNDWRESRELSGKSVGKSMDGRESYRRWRHSQSSHKSSAEASVMKWGIESDGLM
jgi:hypothetical protein